MSKLAMNKLKAALALLLLMGAFTSSSSIGAGLFDTSGAYQESVQRQQQIEMQRQQTEMLRQQIEAQKLQNQQQQQQQTEMQRQQTEALKLQNQQRSVQKQSTEVLKNQSEKDVYTELTKLDDLRKKGIITDAEFEIQKKKILGE